MIYNCFDPKVSERLENQTHNIEHRTEFDDPILLEICLNDNGEKNQV